LKDSSLLLPYKGVEPLFLSKTFIIPSILIPENELSLHDSILKPNLSSNGHNEFGEHVSTSLEKVSSNKWILTVNLSIAATSPAAQSQ
jgi:hypothetical protein